MQTTEAARATLNGHASIAAAADPDPPTNPKRPGGVPGIVTLNVTDDQREELWHRFADNPNARIVAVSRRQLVHLLLDHAHLLAKVLKLHRELRQCSRG